MHITRGQESQRQQNSRKRVRRGSHRTAVRDASICAQSRLQRRRTRRDISRMIDERGGAHRQARLPARRRWAGPGTRRRCQTPPGARRLRRHSGARERRSCCCRVRTPFLRRARQPPRAPSPSSMWPCVQRALRPPPQPHRLRGTPLCQGGPRCQRRPRRLCPSHQPDRRHPSLLRAETAETGGSCSTCGS